MLGIVILNYNSFEDTIKCVNSIQESTQCEYKIYIIDNCSLDDSFLELSKKYLNSVKVKVIKSGKNGGYSFGNNVGIKESLNKQIDALLISNTDIIYEPNAIDSMYDKIRNNINLGVIGPRIKNKSGDLGQAFFNPPSIWNYWKRKIPFRYFIREHMYFSNKLEDFTFRGMVEGSSFIIKTEVIKRIGLLDENVFLFGEESIIAAKLNQIGMDTMIDSEALIFHKHSSTISKEGTAFTKFHMYYSNLYILKNYTNCNKIMLSIAITYDLMLYGVESLTSKSYRDKFGEISKKCFRLLLDD